MLTGGTSGVGLATALQLAARDLPLVLGVHHPEHGEAAREEILALNSQASVDLLPLDLASLSSVREFAAEYAERFGPWGALINNAGVMLAPARHITADGFELQLGVNHLGHYALTGLLLPFADRHARVVTVTSLAARWGRLLFHDLRFDHGYRPFRAYAASKLASLLFAQQLHRKTLDEGLDIVSVATHPGYAVSPERLRSPLGLATRAISQDYAAGAAPNVFAVTDPTLRGGELIAPRRGTHMTGAAAVVPPIAIPNAEAQAARLWRLSGQLTRVPW